MLSAILIGINEYVCACARVCVRLRRLAGRPDAMCLCLTDIQYTISAFYGAFVKPVSICSSNDRTFKILIRLKYKHTNV